MLRTFLFSCLIICSVSTFCQVNFKKDFNEYWDLIHENFAYFDVQKTDWQKVKVIYSPVADTISSRNDFIRLLERVNHELYNGHISLNTNLNSSNRLIPSGSDLWVEYKNKKFIIGSIRQGYAADLSGLKTGMQILRYNGVDIGSAVAALLPKSVSMHDKPMYDYAANVLLAGTHDTKRSIQVITNGKEQTYNPVDHRNNGKPYTLIESRGLTHGISYIKINNSLGNTDLIHAFDSVLLKVGSSNGLIIDLRETPGGGNTTVARAIMGRFIRKTLPYQLHSIPSEEQRFGIKRSWMELVTPRGKIYKKPLILLVNRWTGSMGEGIAMGFDGMGRAQIIGDWMAGLLGANYSYTLSESKIGFSFPAEKLFHINGTARENFHPLYIETDYDAQLRTAVNILKTKVSKRK